jgi:hypothetical protein
MASKALILKVNSGGADRDRSDDLLNAIRKKGILQVLENTELSLPNNGLSKFFVCL